MDPETIYVDTASDVAVGELLLDIASGVGLPADRRERLIALAREFGAISPVRTSPRFPLMVASDDLGAVAYVVDGEIAEHFADALARFEPSC